MDLIANFPHLPPSLQQVVLNFPALQPPEGVEPDFTKPGNRNAVAIAVYVICLTLVTFSAIARIYSRIFIVKQLRLEDCRSYTVALDIGVLHVLGTLD